MKQVMTIAVHYPLAEGEILLRTDRDWNRNQKPDRVSADGAVFEFDLEMTKPYQYYKPLLHQGEVYCWSQGENYLALPNGKERQDIYPHFFADTSCSVCNLNFLSAEGGKRQHAVRVFYPPGYAENTLEHYPVVYMQDGQNLFFPDEAFAGHEWGIDETLGILSGMNLIRKVIVVGVYPQDRMVDYTQTGYERYGRFLLEEVKPWVEQRYRTLTGPANTAVMGSSLGGVVSFYLAWQHPEVFGHAGCLSSTFGFRDNLMERVQAEERRPIRLYLDSGWPRDNYEVTRRMRNLLLERGFVDGEDVLYLAFPYAQHNEASWSMRAHIPFQHFFGTP